MVKLILLRHGRTIHNVIHRYQGQFDSMLDEHGIRQAEFAAEHLVKSYKIDAIYASDLSRTVNTAMPTAKALGLEVRSCKELREVHVGIWENRLVSEVKEVSPEEVRRYNEDPGTFRFTGGENFSEVLDRALRKLTEIAESHADGETVLVVTHGGVIRSLTCHWHGLPISDLRKIPPTPNTSLTVVEYENGTFTLKAEGDNSHIPEELR